MKKSLINKTNYNPSNYKVMNTPRFLLITLVFLFFSNSKLIGQNIIIKKMDRQATQAAVLTDFEDKGSINLNLQQPADTSKIAPVYKTGDKREVVDTAKINHLLIDKGTKVSYNSETASDEISIRIDTTRKEINIPQNYWLPDSK
jgi:hypothetical protein